MTWRKATSGDGRPKIVPIRRKLLTMAGPGRQNLVIPKDAKTGQQTHPDPSKNHPWFEKRVSLRDSEGDWLNNKFFWQAFSQCLRAGGSEVTGKPEDFFDFRYNMDYRLWTGAEEELRGGIKYAI